MTEQNEQNLFSSANPTLHRDTPAGNAADAAFGWSAVASSEPLFPSAPGTASTSTSPAADPPPVPPTSAPGLFEATQGAAQELAPQGASKWTTPAQPTAAPTANYAGGNSEINPVPARLHQENAPLAHQAMPVSTPVAMPSSMPASQSVSTAVAPTPAQATLSTLSSRTPSRRHSSQDVTFDRRFAVLLDLMQHGAWPQALEKLRGLKSDYPAAAFLDSLIDEAELKAELMETWSHKIKGRRLTVGQEWLLRRSLPFVALLILFLSGAIFYQNFVAPSRQVVAMAQANQAQIDEAVESVQLGNYEKAIGLYRGVLTRDPNSSSAQTGLVDAQRQLGFAVNYDIALQVAKAGNLTRALRILQSIYASQPAFRDVDTQIGRLTTLAQAEQIYLAAEKAYAQHRWLEAVAAYEQVDSVSTDYATDLLEQRRNEAYLYAAETIVKRWPEVGAGPEEANTYFRKAQNANLQSDAVAAQLENLDAFFKGERAVRNDELDEAINAWRSLYDANPTYLGGYLAEQLYQAYLTLATQEANKGNSEYARQLAELAAQLQVQDTSAARQQLGTLPVATPTPLATPEPVVAAVVPMAPVVAVAPAAAPEPTATPEATPTPADTYANWIAFRSTREGGEQIYLMRPDGSEQQRAPAELAGKFNELYQQALRATDGRVAFVQSASGRSDANIFVNSGDGSSAMLTNGNGDEYDPVWSPDSERVAYVANSTGNDEIWTMRADGSEPRQLTANNWEWDKHPTWSPDGNQIAFFSNRTGQRQIWVMTGDGANQRNISNNGHDDWDPVWLR